MMLNASNLATFSLWNTGSVFNRAWNSQDQDQIPQIFQLSQKNIIPYIILQPRRASDLSRRAWLQTHQLRRA